MGTYGLEGIIQAWELEKLTVEQAVGQILLLIAEIDGRLGDLERNYSRMNRDAPEEGSLPAPEERSSQDQGS